MNQFKEGDRVVVTNPDDSSLHFYRSGAEGVILEYEDSENILVQFINGDFAKSSERDDFTGMRMPVNSWWVGASEISLA